MAQPNEGGPAAPAPAGGQQPQQQQRGGFIQGIVRMVVMYQLFKMFTGGSKPTEKNLDGSVFQIAPRFYKNNPFDIYLYIDEQSRWADAPTQGDPVWQVKDMPLAGKGVSVGESILYRPSPTVQANGSVWVHTVFTPPGTSPNLSADDFDPTATFGRSMQLNRWFKKPKSKEGTHLLTGKNATDDDNGGENSTNPNDDGEYAGDDEKPILSYLQQNITISMLDEFNTYPGKTVPPHIMKVIDIEPESAQYWPHIWYNDFWNLREYLIPVNETLKEVTLYVSVETINTWKYALFTQVESSFSMQQSLGAMGDGESDDVKKIFLEGNPWLLTLTMCVSTLHSIFDMLAFKNDIGFWKNNKSMVGLSARTILINAGCQLIIFLYLLDNETSMVVLFSTGIGTLIEFWKVTKAMDVKIVPGPPGSLLPWRVSIKDRASYSESRTAEYDATAMRYLSYALYPLVFGYAVYSLVYKPHKSWYSWVLNSLVGAVYMFGFILMCPQLYLNYKLKSVAHLPWRQMTYKFLNTIIDDLFAFIIKMPWLHRLSVFRDDLIFLIYVYQRWIYRVDRTRVNEFGWSEAQPEENEKQEDEGAPAEAEKMESKKDQ